MVGIIRLPGETVRLRSHPDFRCCQECRPRYPGCQYCRRRLPGYRPHPAWEAGSGNRRDFGFYRCSYRCFCHYYLFYRPHPMWQASEQPRKCGHCRCCWQAPRTADKVRQRNRRNRLQCKRWVCFVSSGQNSPARRPEEAQIVAFT